MKILAKIHLCYNMPMLQLKDVIKQFADQVVLRHVDWHVRPTDRIGLCGENGAGKTTLLRLLAGQSEVMLAMFSLPVEPPSVTCLRKVSSIAAEISLMKCALHLMSFWLSKPSCSCSKGRSAAKQCRQTLIAILSCKSSSDSAVAIPLRLKSVES